MRLFKTHKYKSAGLISISIHILGIFLVSSWVIQNKDENLKEKKNVIKVHLQIPKTPKNPKIPPPLISPAKKSPTMETRRKVYPEQIAALPKTNIYSNTIEIKTPAELINKTKLEKTDSHNDSLRSSKNINFTKIETGIPSELIDISNSRAQVRKINKINPAFNFPSPSLITKTYQIIRERQVPPIPSIEAINLNSGKHRTISAISPKSFHESSFHKESRKDYVVSPKASINESISINSISSHAILNNQNGKLPKQNSQPQRPANFQAINSENFSAQTIKSSSVKIIKNIPSTPRTISKSIKNGFEKAEIVLANKTNTTKHLVSAIPIKYSPSVKAHDMKASQILNSGIPVSVPSKVNAKFVATEWISETVDARHSSVIYSNIGSEGSAPNGIAPKSYSNEHTSYKNGSASPTLVHLTSNKTISSSKPMLASFDQDTVKGGYPGALVSEDLTRLRNDFNRRIRNRIAQVKSYPRIAKRRGFEGEPVVSFTINKNGLLTNYSIHSSSGHGILDKAALETIKKAVPYPKIPDKLDVETINLKLPISYRIK